MAWDELFTPDEHGRSMTMTADQLNAKFGIDERISFEIDRLLSAELLAPSAEAHVFLHGGHVLTYQKHGERPVLFVSKMSNYEAGKPIRRGVPLCWPWLGAR